jgi:hypothetical protein
MKHLSDLLPPSRKPTHHSVMMARAAGSNMKSTVLRGSYGNELQVAQDMLQVATALGFPQYLLDSMCRHIQEIGGPK